MHANIQHRFNPAWGEQAPYYRLKESYRDVRGVVHSLIVLNIGFEPSLKPVQVKRIARVLTERFANRNMPSLFKEELDGLDELESGFTHRYWNRMVAEGYIECFNDKEGVARERHAERCSPFLRPSLLLDCKHHPPAVETSGRKQLLDGNRQTHVHTKAGDHRGTVSSLGEKVTLRQCSKPTKEAEKIYSLLKLKQAPFKNTQICRSQPPPYK